MCLGEAVSPRRPTPGQQGETFQKDARKFLVDNDDVLKISISRSFLISRRVKGEENGAADSGQNPDVWSVWPHSRAELADSKGPLCGCPALACPTGP